MNSARLQGRPLGVATAAPPSTAAALTSHQRHKRRATLINDAAGSGERSAGFTAGRRRLAVSRRQFDGAAGVGADGRAAAGTASWPPAAVDSSADATRLPPPTHHARCSALLPPALLPAAAIKMAWSN